MISFTAMGTRMPDGINTVFPATRRGDFPAITPSKLNLVLASQRDTRLS